jgi:hypothetical protein
VQGKKGIHGSGESLKDKGDTHLSFWGELEHPNLLGQREDGRRRGVMAWSVGLLLGQAVKPFEYSRKGRHDHGGLLISGDLGRMGT